MDFAKDNAESAFTFAGKVCNTQTPQELLSFRHSLLTTGSTPLWHTRKNFIVWSEKISGSCNVV